MASSEIKPSQGSFFEERDPLEALHDINQARNQFERKDSRGRYVGMDGSKFDPEVIAVAMHVISLREDELMLSVLMSKLGSLIGRLRDWIKPDPEIIVTEVDFQTR